MAKKFFTILKTDLAVTNFSQNFELIKKTFTGLESAIATAATNPAEDTDLPALRSATIERLEKIAGITRSSLTFSNNHKTDGLCSLSEDSVTILKRIQTEAKAELETLEFLFEQAEDLYTLTQIAAGNPIPKVTKPEPEVIPEPDETASDES